MEDNDSFSGCIATDNNFSIGHLNIRSMNTGFDEFTFYMESYNFDIIGLSETWLSKTQTSNNLRMAGYNFVRNDRHGRGGGVAMYIRKYINFKRVSLDFDSEGMFEFLNIEYTLSSKKYFLSCIYRPPSLSTDNFISKLEDLLALVTPLYDAVVMLGDLNVDFMVNTRHVTNLKNVLSNFNLKQVIDKPTRSVMNSSTLIDVLIVSSEIPIKESKSVEISERITDHNLIYTVLDLPKNKIIYKKINFRDYNNINPNIFEQHALQLPWHEIYNTPLVDDKIYLLSLNIMHLLNKHAPIKTKKVKLKPHTPWITPNIRLMMKLRDKAHRDYKKNKSDAKLQYYRELRNFTKHALARERAAYFGQLATKKGKDFWSTAKKLQLSAKGINYDIPPHLSDPEEIHKYFLQHVNAESTVCYEKLNFYQSNIQNNLNRSFSFQLIDADNILKILSEIHTKAVGEDGISIKDIVLCLPYILNPLINIINTCLLDGVFPSIWKRSIIKPLAKKSEPESISDLRPISILPAISKIIEKYIYQQLSSFSEEMQIIPTCQSGFRKSFSTSTCLVKILNDIRHHEEEKNSTCLALLDFSKAFDTIDHQMLLAKLHFYGISQNAIKFFRNFLQDRSGCVSVINNSVERRSQYRSLSRGVPQGSILSPLLFSIYVADMNNHLQYSTLQQYADDSQLYLPINSTNLRECETKLNLDLDSISEYAKNHNLKLNATKSQAMIIEQNKQKRDFLHSNIQIKINNINIPLKTEIKNLGLTIDNSIKFTSHIDNKIKAAYMRLKNIYHLKNSLPQEVKYYLCETLILSLFDYGDVVYADAILSQYKKKIQKVQNACMRFSFGIPYRDHITPYLSANKILNMENRRRFHMYLFIYRLIHSRKPDYLISPLTPFEHDHQTRNFHLFRAPRHHSANYENSFTFVASSMWNGTSQAVKNLPIRKFHKHIRAMLLQAQT